MTVRNETEIFLQELERFASRPLVHRQELGALIDAARSNGRTRDLEEAAFHAKFISKSVAIMKRIGPGGEGFGKLQTEVQSSAQIAVKALRAIVEDLPDPERVAWEEDFFRADVDSFGRLLKLMEDLAWFKNWTLDGHRWPSSP